jgi:hypothetical protein
MPGISADAVSRVVEETLYTVVGLGVLGFQHLQVQRRELRRSLASGLDDVRAAVDDRLKVVEERLSDLVDRTRGTD